MKKLIILSLLLVGCGSRKVIVDKQETKTEVSQSTKIVDISKIDTNIKTIDRTNTTEFIIEPIDNTKPIFVDGKKYENVRFKTLKKANNINTTESKKEVKGVIIDAKKEVKQQIEVKHKEIEKTFSYWWLLWFLLLIPIYLIYRKYKNYLV
jgi:hypothetical protein